MIVHAKDTMFYRDNLRQSECIEEGKDSFHLVWLLARNSLPQMPGPTIDKPQNCPSSGDNTVLRRIAAVSTIVVKKQILKLLIQ